MTRRSGPGRRELTADIAVLGAGSATAAFVGALRGTPRVVVFEPGLVGGECPYDGCIPSKALLHDGRTGRSWDRASRRRRDLVHHRDDGDHVAGLLEAGDVELVRDAASLLDEHRVQSESVVVTADHVVLAAGAEPLLPPIDGLESVRDRAWTSADALRASAPPDRLIVLGGGVIGCELAQLFTGFGSDVVVVEPEERLFDALHPAVSDEVHTALRSAGVELVLGRRPATVRPHGEGIAVIDEAGGEVRGDRLLIATGRRAATSGLGLESLGLSPDHPLPVDETGRVRCAGSVWAIGDVAGRAQYTHAASHHGRVVADRITGHGRRRFDDVVDAACMFTDPPLMTVGPTYAATRDDPDVAWVVVDVASASARAATDERGGALAVAADRRTRRVVAAHGVGAGFDELVHAVVVAVDGCVPIDRLVESMVPFPTMGDVWRAALERLAEALDPVVETR